MDEQEISDFFDQNLHIRGGDESYADIQYCFVNDNNNNNYSNGQVQFNLTSTGNKFQILRDSYLVLPLTITSSNTAYTGFAANKIAIKNSLVSLIQGLTITTADGTSIVAEQGSTPIINNLKVLLDSSIDFYNSSGQQLHFGGKDTNTTPANGNSLQPWNVTTGSPTIDVTSNQGLMNRISCFQSTSTFNAGSFSFIAYIPLRFIHSFFDMCSFPLVNMPLLITFNIAGTTSYSQHQPFTCATQQANGYVDDAGAATAIAAVAASSAPVVTITPSADERGTGFIPGSCRIYLKTVTFNAKTASAIASKIQTGFTKYIDFTTSDLYILGNQTVTAANSYQTVNYQITSASVRPRRVWVLPVTTGTLTSAANTFPASIGNYVFSQVNLAINSQNYYQSNLQSQYEMYKILAEQMVGCDCSSCEGAHISYVDYLNGMNPLCLDISRLKQLDLNNPCQLQLQANIKSKSGTTAYDLVCVVERSVTLKLNFSSAGVRSTITLGTNRN